MTRRALVLAVLALSVGACRSTSTVTSVPRTPVVYLVRHAEKAPTPANDPVLSELGMARASALAAILVNRSVTDVVVTDLQRTRLTAAPFLQQRPTVVVHVVPIGTGGTAAHVQAAADTLRAIAAQRGKNGTLVVGHSNTVTKIVAALGALEPPPICDSQYRLFFTVDLTTRAVERSAYGAPDPVDATCQQSAPTMLMKP